MTQPFLLNIAGIVCEIQPTTAAYRTAMLTRYADFIVEDADEIAMRLTIQRTEALSLLPQTRGTTWQTDIERQGDKLHVTSYHERGTIDLANRTATLELAPHVRIENFLRIIYAWLCLDNDGLLVHAAGIIRDGQGFVFFGPSGSGKSTTAKLSAGSADILSDDLVIVRKLDGRFHLFGVPFRGEMAEAGRLNRQAPLVGLYRLRQASAHRIQSLSLAQAVAELSIVVPFVVKTKEANRQLMHVSAELAQTVGVQQLQFRKNPEFWQVIDDNLATVS